MNISAKCQPYRPLSFLGVDFVIVYSDVAFRLP